MADSNISRMNSVVASEIHTKGDINVVRDRVIKETDRDTFLLLEHLMGYIERRLYASKVDGDKDSSEASIRINCGSVADCLASVVSTFDDLDSSVSTVRVSKPMVCEIVLKVRPAGSRELKRSVHPTDPWRLEDVLQRGGPDSQDAKRRRQEYDSHRDQKWQARQPQRQPFQPQFTTSHAKQQQAAAMRSYPPQQNRMFSQQMHVSSSQQQGAPYPFGEIATPISMFSAGPDTDELVKSWPTKNEDLNQNPYLTICPQATDTMDLSWAFNQREFTTSPPSNIAPTTSTQAAISSHPSPQTWSTYGISPLPSSLMFHSQSQSVTIYSPASTPASTGQESHPGSHWPQGLSPHRNSGFASHGKSSKPKEGYETRRESGTVGRTGMGVLPVPPGLAAAAAAHSGSGGEVVVEEHEADDAVATTAETTVAEERTTAVPQSMYSLYRPLEADSAASGPSSPDSPSSSDGDHAGNSAPILTLEELKDEIFIDEMVPTRSRRKSL